MKCVKNDKNEGGQCVYWALNKCLPGVLSLVDLNEQIGKYYRERRKFDKSFQKEDAGTPDESWHHSCNYKALESKYGKGNFVWRKVPYNGMEDI